MAKKKGKKATPKKNTPTVEQLQATAKDLNNLMNDLNEGEYVNPIKIDENAKNLTKEITGMVGKEMFKQDKGSLNESSIAVIEQLGIKFEDLRDDPEQAVEEKEAVEEKIEEEVIDKKEAVEEKAVEKVTAEKKEGKAKVQGVIKSIVEIIKEQGPITKQEVLDILVKRFPDRPVKGMGSTFNIQVGGRLTKERGIKITKGDNGFSIEK